MKVSTHIRKLTFAAAIFYAVGCGRGVDMLEAPNSNPVELTSAYPAVVKVILPQGKGLCTGTFISPRAVLTAAHCTLDAGQYYVISSFGTFTTYNVNALGPGVVNDPNDVSMLVLSRDVADPALGQVIPIGTGVSVGDRVRLVGFGCNDFNARSGSGTKRTGTNQVADVGAYIQLITPPFQATGSTNAKALVGASNRAGACFGDSGGPLLVSPADGLRVVGVSHAGGFSDDNIISQYVHLNRTDNRSFLQSMDSRFSLNIFDPCWEENGGMDCRFDQASAQIFALLKWLMHKFLMIFY